jgi:hypothetical protein
MNKKYTISLCLISSFYFSTLSQAQTWEVYNEQLQLQSRLMYDKIELLSETVRIGKKGDEISLLSKDLTPAVVLQGKEVYQYLEPWILVKGENGIGAYHEYGQLVLPLEYEEIQTYYNLLLAKKAGSYWLFERGTGKTTSLGRLDEAKLTRLGMVITRKGNEYFLPLSKNPDKPYELLEESEGDFILAKEVTGFGLINREGDYVMDPVIDRLEPTKGNFYYGFDERQYLLIEGNDIQSNIRYNSFHEITFQNGLMLEYIHGKLRRVMEEDGILLDAVGIEEVKMIGNNLYNVRFRDGKLGLLGKTGWLVQPMDSVDQIDFGTEGLFPAKAKGAVGFVNQLGIWIIPAQFSEASLFKEKLASYRNSTNWGLINSSGEIISTPQWEEIKPFVKGISIAKNSGKFYLINKSGVKINTEGFDNIFRASDDFFLVENAGNTGLLDPTGNVLLPAEFQNIRREKKDFLVVNKDGLTGVINESGEVILPLAYQEILVDWNNGQILTKSLYEPVVVQLSEPTGKRNKKGA